MKTVRTLSGFSLIEVLIAIGIVGAIGYFVSSLFQTSLKSSNQANLSLQADTFKRKTEICKRSYDILVNEIGFLVKVQYCLRDRNGHE